MKKMLSAFFVFLSFNLFAQEAKSRISSVKVYQNQALVERQADITLKRGENTVILSGLPKVLLDWSVKSSLPKDSDAKIMSVKIEQKMLLERFQKQVGAIEEKLKDLRKKDQQYIDEISSIRTQEKFIDSVLNFTESNTSKELQTRIPQVKVWEETLSYCTDKKKDLNTKKRRIENDREDLGREIQKYEFELEQIAGQNYYTNFQSLNRANMKNKSSMEVQQYAEANNIYAQQIKLLKNPEIGTDIEKQIVLNIFSAKDAEIKIDFSYLIQNTYWNMLYDVRASRENGRLGLSVYGDVYQKTGEDWNEVKLFLSTGSPSNNVENPSFYPWYLNAYEYDEEKSSSRGKAMPSAKMKKAEAVAQEAYDENIPAAIPQTAVSEKGAFVEMELPLRQSIVSSDRNQKKFIKEYSFIPGKELNFNYEIYLWQNRSSFITAELTNSTDIPWMQGEAQVFFENEYTGKIQIPFMPSGKKETIFLGKETRISAEKILVKKYEDSKGVFGGKKRIVFSYQIEIQNNTKRDQEVILRERIPVSQNEKIEVEIKNNTAKFLPAESLDDYAYKQGQRKIVQEIKAGQKTTVSYDLIVSYDKDLNISGLE